MMRSRIIDKVTAQTVDRWDFPAVDPTAADALRGAGKGGAHLLTAGQLDALQRQVHDEAYQRGFDEGLRAGEAEVVARAARLTAIAEQFTHPFQSLERAVEDEIVALAVTLASHLVRREIAHEPELLHAAIHDCLGVLANNVRDVAVHLNPDDAELVRSQLAAGPDLPCTVVADPELARGDLRVASASSLVDGSLAARCAEIIAAASAATRSGEPST
jgi:flagellar assembly protein FliH